MLRKYFTLYVLLISASFVRAQEGSSSYSAVGRGGVATTFVTDYRAIGVNPANLGLNQSHRDPKITFGFFEINSTFFSGAFSRKQLFDAA